MHLHFIAIGGAAMHSLALALHRKGYRITGSDDVIFEPSRSRLAAAGLLPNSIGWFPETITPNIDAIVLGMHAKPNNPELLRAQELDIPIYSYPAFLYQHSKNKTRVVIAGSHGKTTITAMVLHTLRYHNVEVDFMIGAPLEGFDTMVHLTETNDFIVLEGDEYLSSPIDRQPKFHHYHPNIALLSGIAWDHINVFPTYELYADAFRVFIDSIVNGGILVYNEEDAEVKRLAEASQNPIRKHPYRTHPHRVENGKTFLETPEGLLPLAIFGKHNLSNLWGAKWICQHLGIDEADFYEAIAHFKGAAKRLEKIAEGPTSAAYRDFAHAPSKVAATVQAVKEQYPHKLVTACLELHTYSSLNAAFLSAYQGALDAADTAVVFYSPEAVKIKQLQALSTEQIAEAFGRDDLLVFTDAVSFQEFLFSRYFENSVLLLMSSGDYGGLDIGELKKLMR